MLDFPSILEYKINEFRIGDLQMARSMTAYGRSHVATETGFFLLEIHSVNKKFFDLSIQLPKDLLILDMDFRKIVAEKIKRGNIVVKLQRQDFADVARREKSLDPEVMGAVYKQWQDCAKKLGFNPDQDILFSDLLTYTLSKQPTLCFEITDAFKKELEKGLEEAIDSLVKMKVKEGAVLVSDIKSHLQVISSDLEIIIKYAEGSSKKYHEKLQKRIEEFKLITEEDQERLMRELVVFADRVDVTEEVTRLRSHLAQFYDHLSSKESRLGRELEFILQEMNREVNTVGAKAQDLEITKRVVEMKGAIEKIREQIQNIE